MGHYQISGRQSTGNQHSLRESTSPVLPGGRSIQSDDLGEEYRKFSKLVYSQAWDNIERERRCIMDGVPLGFIDSTQSSTTYPRMSKQAASEKFWSQWSSNREYEQWQNRKEAKQDPKKFLDSHQSIIRESSKRSIYRLSQFPSGELTGNLITLGRENKCCPSVRRGQVETYSLSGRGKTKIRRAVECATDNLKYFATLTFSPSLSELNPDGTVNHYWAKSELHRFLDALTKISIRKGRPFNYLWVAEIQTKSTNNIHFHIMWNQFFPIKKLIELWKQANNSVDIKTLKNVHHAKRYVMKYISSEEETAIRGNRYAISSGLRFQMQAVTFLIEETGARREATSLIGSFSDDIKLTGGYANEWGFSIPMPERPRKTPSGEYPGVSRQISLSLMDLLLGELPF